jgi:hypothetical protein
VTYELWSKVSRSAVGAYGSEDEALAVVRNALITHGRAYAEGFAIIREDSRGRSKLIADGAALVERAQVMTAPRDRISA